MYALTWVYVHHVCTGPQGGQRAVDSWKLKLWVAGRAFNHWAISPTWFWSQIVFWGKAWGWKRTLRARHGNLLIQDGRPQCQACWSYLVTRWLHRYREPKDHNVYSSPLLTFSILHTAGSYVNVQTKAAEQKLFLDLILFFGLISGYKVTEWKVWSRVPSRK